jgi:SSS family solute:Na+ symporter
MLTVVVIFYLGLSLLVGVFLSRRVKKTSDFLIAGRKLGLLLTTATLSAVQIGAGVILGGAEMGAGKGMWPGLWYGLGCGGGLILAGILVAARLRERGGVVPLDFFAVRYGERRWVRVWGWLSNIPSLLGILVAQLLAAGSILSLFGLDFHLGLLLIGAVLLFYSVMGGMWGVVMVDFIQVSIIVLSIPVVALIALARVQPVASLHAILGTPFIPQGMLSQAIFLIAPFLLSISVSYDAFMRYQSARSARVAQWGCILSGIIVIFISFCTALVGSAGRILFPAIESGAILPHVVRVALPPIFAGIVVAALLAATMSSGNCLLISLSGCFSRDFYNMVLNPTAKLDDLKYGKQIARATIFVALTVAILVAFRAKGILQTIIIFNYPYMGSMLVPLLGGVLWKGATRQGAFAAMATGGFIGVGAFLLGIPSPWQGKVSIDLGLFIAYFLSLLVFVLVSLWTSQRRTLRREEEVLR